MKQIALLLVAAVSVLAFAEEEKPCGHAHSAASLFKAAAPSLEQQKIDMHYYKLNFDLNAFNRTMRNEFTAEFSVLDTSLRTIQLDYSTDNLGVGDITVREVVLDGDTVDFSHNNDLLSIPITDSLEIGQEMSVLIYSHTSAASRRNDQGFNWDTARDGIYTNSQPYDARDWWPSVDYPRDKADSVDIIVTIDEAFTVASNGKLMSSVDDGNGKKTWHWHVGYPIATYLVSLSIYDFYEWGDIYVDANQDTLPILFYTYTPPENPDPSYMTANYRLLPEMLTLYAGQFGPYPFMDEKYGHAEWGEGYGMEHQTLTSMGNPTERRVAHELAHMWYGDMITCESYHHIWLNEGFASYAEALWWEHRYGKTGYKDKMKTFQYFGNGTIYVENPETDKIFDWDLSYAKGAWVLHMLRRVVGSETFFEIMRTYADHPDLKHNTATTEQFQAVCESVSGMDLETFFQQWIYGSLFPRYAIYWAQSDTELLIETTQTSTIFDMPVDLRIKTTNMTIDTVLRIDVKDMVFTIDIPEGETVTTLVLDPDNWLLNSATYQVGVVQEENNSPASFMLKANYPNPFNPSTTIPFSVNESGRTHLSVLNINGEVLVDLVDEDQAPGHYRTVWDGVDRNGKKVEAGVYFCRLQSGSQTAVQKILMLK